MQATYSDTWNQRFAIRPECYGTAPNSWLAENAGRIPPKGAVLCLAEGQGRNAIWLAQRGLSVTAVDFSEIALAQLARRARRTGVTVATIEADLATWPTPEAAYDAVVLVFAHFVPAVRLRVHRLAVAALKPGGVVILEAFNKRQLGLPSGGPRDEEMLQSSAELQSDFAALRIEHLGETEVTLDEGPLHHGPARVVRLIGIR